ncbi:hypothetical protein IFM89_034660 [Coptis chinensis]|uniref:NAD-dependent epimerase/dehydratase domain-containing protein n=1 Tax=Coptis chinensis TaxID=261450 RepID=A0A835LXR3_9MAGN|nr:hypothetical protein IFM89_034660 [Coptis chinensis]
MGPRVNKTAMKRMEPILDQNYHLAEENSKLWKETQTNQMNFDMQLEEIRSTMVSTTNSFVPREELPRGTRATNIQSVTDVEYLYSKKPPTWGYATLKTLAEKTAWKYAKENKINLIIVIPSLMVGPSSLLMSPVASA